jgi:hypothetical protein
MSTIRPLWLLLICLGSALAGWAAELLLSTNGFSAPVLQWPSLVTMAAGMLITLLFGLRVQRYKRGKLKRRLDPLQAARTLVLAQATAYAGALIAGWHAGILVDLLRGAGLGNQVVISSLVMIVAALVMVIVGWVVEQFCKLPPDDPSAPDSRGRDREDNEGYATGAS